MRQSNLKYAIPKQNKKFIKTQGLNLALNFNHLDYYLT